MFSEEMPKVGIFWAIFEGLRGKKHHSRGQKSETSKSKA